MTAAMTPIPETANALAAFVAVSANADAARVFGFEWLSGGAIQENWAVTVEIAGGPMSGRHEAALRTDAPSSVAASRGRAEEFLLLKVAFASGASVPEPLWLDAAGTVAGRPLFLMRRISGTAAGHRLVRAGRDDEARRTLVRSLGAELARIHAIRPPRPDLEFLGVPPRDPAAAAIAMLRGYLDALPRAYPALEWGLRRLETTAPSPAPEDVVLVHRDYRVGNIMIDGDRVTGVLDWEFAGWGDRHEDLGWFTARCWRFGRDEFEAGGLGAAEDFFAGYEETSGRAVDRERVRYWQAMAHARWAAIAAGQGDRFVSGGERTLELALTAHMVPELELELLRQTGPKTHAR